MRESSPLLPAHVARLAGFAALALLGALQWQRLVAGLSSVRAVVWVLLAVATAAALVWASTRPRWAASLTLGVTMAGLFGAYVASGLELGLLKPRRWDELVAGLAGGTEALGTVKLPYDAASAWPALTLQLTGALLCVLAALLAFWPREGERGYRFMALATLLVLVASPLVSLGGTRQVLLGFVLAAFTVCFLWLERLPLRPGLGVGALLALALAGALPLAAVADGDEPWFDYRSFAEGLGPEDPIRFDWNHSYGPITWPREGTEVLRVATETPSYWKLRDLTEFDGAAWRGAGADPARSDATLDLPSDYRDRPGWTEDLEVTIRRLRGTEVVSSGTALAVSDASREIRPGGAPGRFLAESEFRRGDSYTVSGYTPRPSAGQLQRARSGERGLQGHALLLTVPFREDAPAPVGLPTTPDGTPVRSAVVRFPSFDAWDAFEPTANYPTVRRSGSGPWALRQSTYRRTWRLAQRLRRGTETPYEYVRAVDAFLQDGFSYSERPTPVDPGLAVLDGFLHDTRSGYCQHFSGAMALLLRMGGVPARVVTGFSPGGYSKRKEAWIVRDTDAHSWVEVWFDSLGWVTFDPTPDATPARSQIAALEEAPEPAETTEGESDAASGGTGGDGGRSDSGVRADLLQDPLRDAGGAAGGDGGPAWWWALPPLALLATALAWWLGRRRRRSAPPRTQLDRLIAELEAALRRSGRPAPVGTTLRQLETRLGGSPEAAGYLRTLASGRYGPSTTLPTLQQRRALRRELGSGLGAGGRLRAFLALPPWRD